MQRLLSGERRIPATLASDELVASHCGRAYSEMFDGEDKTLKKSSWLTLVHSLRNQPNMEGGALANPKCVTNPIGKRCSRPRNCFVEGIAQKNSGGIRFNGKKFPVMFQLQGCPAQIVDLLRAFNNRMCLLR